MGARGHQAYPKPNKPKKYGACKSAAASKTWKTNIIFQTIIFQLLFCGCNFETYKWGWSKPPIFNIFELSIVLRSLCWHIPTDIPRPMVILNVLLFFFLVCCFVSVKQWLCSWDRLLIRETNAHLNKGKILKMIFWTVILELSISGGLSFFEPHPGEN